MLRNGCVVGDDRLPLFAVRDRVIALALPPHDRLVALCIGDHMNTEGVAWPSRRRIGEWTGLASSTVRACLRRLCSGPAPVFVSETGGSRSSNTYRLAPMRGPWPGPLGADARPPQGAATRPPEEGRGPAGGGQGVGARPPGGRHTVTEGPIERPIERQQQQQQQEQGADRRPPEGTDDPERTALIAEGQALVTEISTATNVSPRTVLRAASAVPGSGAYLTSLSKAKTLDYLVRTVNTLRDDARMLGLKAGATVDPEVRHGLQTSAAWDRERTERDLAFEFAAWHLDNHAGKMPGETIVSWAATRGVDESTRLRVLHSSPRVLEELQAQRATDAPGAA